MKKLIIVILFALMIFVSVSCINDVADNDAEHFDGKSKTENDIGADTEDDAFAYEIPADFDICYKTWIGSDKNVYDTYSGTLIKDLAPGSASAKLEADRETFAEIYQMLVSCEIVSIKREMTSEVITPDPELLMMVEPLTHYEITFTANGETYTVIGDATAAGYVNDDADAKNFMSFCDFMSRLMYDALRSPICESTESARPVSISAG